MHVLKLFGGAPTLVLWPSCNHVITECVSSLLTSFGSPIGIVYSNITGCGAMKMHSTAWISCIAVEITVPLQKMMIDE